MFRSTTIALILAMLAIPGTVLAGAGPAVTGVSSTAANGTYGTGAVLPITVSFTAPVVVTGTPQLALNSGGTANYISGSGTSTLTLNYTVGSGQSSSHLDYTSTAALTLNGGTITSGGTNASLTLPAPGSAGSLGANKNIIIDTTAPTVVQFRVLFGSQSYNLIGSSRSVLPWQITGIQAVFSKPITSGDVNSLTGLSATGFSGLGTNTLTWSFAALSNAKPSASLAGSGADALKDAAGNPLESGAGFSKSFQVLYGDFNGDGFVTASDIVGVYASTAKAYDIFADINGDGVVNLTDVQIVRTRSGAKL